VEVEPIDEVEVDVDVDVEGITDPVAEGVPVFPEPLLSGEPPLPELSPQPPLRSAAAPRTRTTEPSELCGSSRPKAMLIASL
jgi:hypothetical protein